LRRLELTSKAGEVDKMIDAWHDGLLVTITATNCAGRGPMANPFNTVKGIRKASWRLGGLGVRIIQLLDAWSEQVLFHAKAAKPPRA
jgi:hypothetical protein